MQVIAPAYDGYMGGPERRSGPEGGYLCCQPAGHRCRTQTAFRLRRNAVDIAIDVENVDLFSIDAHQRLRGSYHDAAVSTNEQRAMPRLL
jgi:hypothetical protein